MKNVSEVLLSLTLGSLKPAELPLSAKDFVVSKYQDAECVPMPSRTESTTYLVPKFGIKSKEESWMLGTGQTEDETWEDAAQCLIVQMLD